MKNIFKTFALLFAVLFITNVFAGDRLMLVEFFTSSTCGPCAANNPTLTAFLNSHDIERIAGIGFHMSWPAPGNDPMYLYNTTDNDARRNVYGINAIPQGRFDGINALNSPYSSTTFQYYYDQDVNTLSPVSVILTDSTFGDSVKVRAVVYCEQFMTTPNVSVYIAVVEGHIHYTSPPGTNGETDFYNVMRKLLPTANGTQLTLVPGDVKVLEYKYKKDPLWVANEVYELAWVQNAATKNIYTAAKKTQNFTLIPNVGYKSVPQAQSGSATYKIKVPVIASGYNSPITFTATVSPATSGITTSFPNGNILSNFLDSISLQVNSTASVPTGSYQIVVTGTNSSSKYHTTVVNYLVGKNYVMVGTNRPNEAQFKVNGTLYGSSQLFEWALGSTQTLQAISPVNNGDHQAVFLNWSNSGDTTQTITVNSTTSQYVANYKEQFKLNASTAPSGIISLVNIDGGNAYYDSAGTASVNITPLQVVFNGTNYIFQKWLGAGVGSYTGTNPNFQVTLNNYINEIAVYIVNTGINQIGNEVPDKFELSQNYPNPFNPVTTIKFAIPKASNVVLKVYDILGKEVETIHNGYLNAGYYQISFDAKNLASGMYFYKIEAEKFTDLKRMVLLK